MTEPQRRRAVVYVGNGATTSFPYNFLIRTAQEVKVLVLNKLTGEEALLMPGQYTISGLGNDNGGLVTYNPATGPLTSDYLLRIEAAEPYRQDMDLLNQGGFHPETVEAGMDALARQIQQLRTELERAPRFGGFDPASMRIAAPEPNKFLQVSGTGQSIQMGDLGNAEQMVPGTSTVGSPQVIDQSLRQLDIDPDQIGYWFETLGAATTAGPLAKYPAMVGLYGTHEPGDAGFGVYKATTGDPGNAPKFQIGPQWYVWAMPYVTPEAMGYHDTQTDMERRNRIQAAIYYSSEYLVPCYLMRRYSVTGLNMPLEFRANAQIIGQGMQTGIDWTGSGYVLQPDLGVGEHLRGVRLVNFEVRGPGTDEGYDGIALGMTLDAYVENVSVTGRRHAFMLGGAAGFNCQRPYLVNCQASNCHVGFVVGNDLAVEDCQGAVLVNCLVNVCTEGIAIYSGLFTTIIAPTISDFTLAGIEVSVDSVVADIYSPAFRFPGNAAVACLAVTEDADYVSVYAPLWAGTAIYRESITQRVRIDGRFFGQTAVPSGVTIPAGSQASLSIALADIGWTGLSSGRLAGAVSLPSGLSVFGVFGGNSTTHLHMYIVNLTGSAVDISNTAVTFFFWNFVS